MTVSALVRVLVESFLPDMRRKYVIQNLKVSEWYRQYRSFVPDFLRGRPRSLIIHCLERQARAKKFDEANIKSNPQDGTFTIMKQVKGSHTVDFGVDSSEPSCTCKDWKKWKIPCKHFFAVFNTKPEWGWNALPPLYLQSACLSCDTATVTCFYKDFGEETSDATSQHAEQIDMKEYEPSGNSESIVEKEPFTQLQSPDQFLRSESNEGCESSTQLKSSRQLEGELTDESNTTDRNHVEIATQLNDEIVTTDEMPKKKVRNMYEIILFYLLYSL